MSSVAILPLAKLDCHLNQFFFVSYNFSASGVPKKCQFMCKLLCFQSAPGEKKIPNFWKFTLLGLHYTSFRPAGPPAQDLGTQNINTSVSALIGKIHQLSKFYCANWHLIVFRCWIMNAISMNLYFCFRSTMLTSLFKGFTLSTKKSKTLYQKRNYQFNLYNTVSLK